AGEREGAEKVSVKLASRFARAADCEDGGDESSAGKGGVASRAFECGQHVSVSRPSSRLHSHQLLFVARLRNRFTPPIPLVDEEREQFLAERPFARVVPVPFADHVRGGGIEPSNARQPKDAGILGAVTDGRVVPGNMGRQATGRQCGGKSAGKEQRRALLQKVDDAVEPAVADV